MKYYKMYMTGEYNVWKKYFTFDYHFFYRNKEIYFKDTYKDLKVEKLKIKVLSKGGCYVKNQTFFKKDIAPPIINVESIFLFRDDLIEKKKLNEIEEIKFVKIKVDGNFRNAYYILVFDKVIDCVNFGKSTKSEFDFFSKIVFEKTKTPENTNGFFLDKWSEYNQYPTIVNENLKNILLSFEGGKIFLKFNKIDYE